MQHPGSGGGDEKAEDSAKLQVQDRPGGVDNEYVDQQADNPDNPETEKLEKKRSGPVNQAIVF
jgi:hypothetical protein